MVGGAHDGSIARQPPTLTSRPEGFPPNRKKELSSGGVLNE